jgi:hypothetical protein
LRMGMNATAGTSIESSQEQRGARRRPEIQWLTDVFACRRRVFGRGVTKDKYVMWLYHLLLDTGWGNKNMLPAADRRPASCTSDPAPLIEAAAKIWDQVGRMLGVGRLDQVIIVVIGLYGLVLPLSHAWRHAWEGAQIERLDAQLMVPRFNKASEHKNS